MNSAFFDTVFEFLPPLDAEDFWVITAWNPDAVIRTAAENRMADARLLERLRSAGLRCFRVIGRSPDGKHAEPGWGVLCDDGCALALAAEFQQVAVFHFSGDEIFVVETSSGERTRLTERPDRVLNPAEHRVFILYAATAGGTFTPEDEALLRQLAGTRFPSFSVQTATGVFRSEVEEIRCLRIATPDARSILALAEEVRVALHQEGIGVESGGIYQRVCEWTDHDHALEIWGLSGRSRS